MSNTTKERILKGATLLFTQQDPAKVTMDEIADFMKVSKKTLYNHFRSKRELIVHVVSSTMNEILETLEEIADNPKLTFIGRLKVILEYAFAEISRREGLIMDNYISFAIEERESPGEILRKKILELAERLFREGTEEGMVQNDLAAEFIPYFYLNVIEGCIRIYKDNTISIRKDELFREAMRITLEGVLSSDGRNQFTACNDSKNERPELPVSPLQ